MRTKIGKRIGPVPIALVAVLALAAFISAGFWLVPNSSQTVQAQEFNDAGATEAGAKCEAPTAGELMGGGCMTTGDSVDVIFAGTVNIGVYVTGGSDYPNVRASTSLESGNGVTVMDEELLGQEGVDAHLLSLGSFDVDEVTITVTRDMADAKGEVYLWAYVENNVQDLMSSSTSLNGPDQFAVKVDFIGAPVKDDGKAMMVDGAVKRTDDDPCKRDTSPNNMIDQCSSVTVAATLSSVMFDFKDAYGRPVDGNVTVTLSDHSAGAESIKLANGTDQQMIFGESIDSVKLKDVPSASAAPSVRVKVTASIESDSGSGSFSAYIIRKGRPDSVEAMPYQCHERAAIDMNADGNTTDPGEAALACNTGEQAADRKAPGSLTAGENKFYIMGVVKDASGNPLDDQTVSFKPAGRDNPGKLMSPSAATTNTKGTYTSMAVGIDEDPEKGTHMMEVSTGSGTRKKSTMISVVIGGDATMISVECTPDPVPTATGQTNCVATVTDDNGNAPSNLDTTTSATDNVRDTVLIIVRNEGAKIAGATNDRVNIDAQGMAMFSVVFSEDARQGPILINVSALIAGEAMQDSITVTYGEAGVTDVITGFNRGGALQVSWTKAANASGYIIIAINVNDVNNDVVAVVLNDGDLDTRNISGLTPGATYDIYVAATASGGRNTLSDAARVTAK